MNSNQILERLFLKYYSDDKFLASTSSHWKYYQRKTSIIKKQGSYELKGFGFGNPKKNNVLNLLKTLPERLMLRKLLRENNSSHKTFNNLIKLIKSWNMVFNNDHVRNLLSFDLIDSHGLFNKPGYVCIIGDGYGFLGTLIKTMFPKKQIIFVNLGKILLFDIYYFSKIFPEIDLFHLEQYEEQNIMTDHSMIVLESEKCELMKKLPISLFINIASMQEMNISEIQKYFSIMRTSTVESYFYCCNREEKTLPDDSVIRFSNYPWDEEERILIDEPCPWHQQYPSKWPPFWRDYDGTHLHRLIKLNTKENNGFY